MISAQASSLKQLLIAAKQVNAPIRSVLQQRASLEALAQMTSVVAGTSLTPTSLAGLVAEIVEPANISSDRWLLYLHGGAYTAGSIATHRALVSRICEKFGGRAIMPEYRLAPENPFPQGLDDAFGAYLALLENVGNAQNIVLGGDSAGGGLVLGLMLRARAMGIALPDRFFLISPWTDLTGDARSVVERADSDPFLNAANLVPAASLYLDGQDPRNPLASPLFADLSNLPPSIVLVGTDEILYDDSEHLVTKLQQCGSVTRLIVGEGMWHVWPAFAMIPESDEAIAEIAAFIEHHDSPRAQNT